MDGMVTAEGAAVAEKKQGFRVPIWLGLLLLYGAGVLCRVLLALAFSQNPSIMPDESLYFNLARSIFTSGEVLYRGQPITYDSLLYPLVLSPLFLLPQSINLFRVIQVANALLMNAAVFPAFFMARRVTGRESAAWLVAGVSLLLPDLAMTEIIMTESLGYPLLLFALFFMYRAFSGRRVLDTVLATVFSFLLYATKPGAIAVGAAFCLCLLVRGIRSPKGERKAPLAQCLVATLLLAALALLWRGMATWVFGVDYGLTSVYAVQMHPFTLDNILRGLNGLPLYLFFFPVAMLAYPLLVPMAHDKALPREDRSLLWTAVLASLFTILGICYVIYVEEYTGDPFAARIHLRYLFGFVPVFFMLSLSPALRDRKGNGRFVVLLSFLAACALTFTVSAFISGESFPIDALMMASFNGYNYHTNLKTVAQLLLLLLLAVGGYWIARHGWTRKMSGAVLGLFMALSLLNNVAGYGQMQHNMDAQWTHDARQMNAGVQPGSYLAVAEDVSYLWNPTTTLDMHSRSPVYVAELDDVFENTGLSGAYTPFVPRQYWREHSVNETPAVQWLVMDAAICDRVLVRNMESAIVTDNMKYIALPVANGESWVHSGLTGLNNGWIRENARLMVFDEALCAQETIKVWLQVRAEGATQVLALESGEYYEEFYVGTETQWVEAEVPANTGDEPFRLYMKTPGSISVDTYLVE